MDRTAPELADLPPTRPVRAGGVALGVRRLGPEEADPTRRAPRLILLHGGPGLDHHILLPLGLALARRYEVWLPDLPGHGESVARSAAAGSCEPCRLPGLGAVEERLGRWLHGLQADGGMDALVGHSLGAWLVRELLRPDGGRGGGQVPVRAAVLLAPPAAGQRGEVSSLRRAGDLVRRGRKEASGRGEARARREVRLHVEAEASGPLPPLFLAAVARARLRDPRLYPALTGELHRRLVAPPKPYDPGCPVLVLCGEGDRTTPPDQARQVTEGLEGARLELLPGTGHYPFADALEATAGAIDRFLAQTLA